MHRHHPPTEDLDWALEVGVRHRPAPLLLSIFPVCAGAQRANVCEWGKWGTRGRRRFQQTLIFLHFLRFPPQCAKSGCARVAEPCCGKPQQHNQHRHQEAMAKPMQNFWRSLCCTSVKKSLCFVKAVRARPRCPVLNQLPQSVVFEDMIPLLWRRCG